MRQESISSLVQVMACRLVGDKPSSEPIMTYCHLCSFRRWTKLCQWLWEDLPHLLHCMHFCIECKAMRGLIHCRLLQCMNCLNFRNIIRSIQLFLLIFFFFPPEETTTESSGKHKTKLVDIRVLVTETTIIRRMLIAKLVKGTCMRRDMLCYR